jgi:hypothetical protein
MYSPTLSLTSTLDRVGGQRHVQAAVPYCIGGTVWPGGENVSNTEI